MTYSHTSKEFRRRSLAIASNKAAYWMSRYWYIGVIVLTGLWVALPWLAPMLMKAGWTDTGNAVYFIYSFQCHQLPQRSFFLFGSNMSYSLGQIQQVLRETFREDLDHFFCACHGGHFAWN